MFFFRKSTTMVFTLIVVRHGDADHMYGPRGDFDRQLTAKGQLQASHTGQQLKSMLAQSETPSKDKRLPLLALVSEATRAMETANQLLGALDRSLWERKDIDRLYLANARTIIDEIVHNVQQPQQVKSPLQRPLVMVVGHNPGVSHLASDLSGEDCSLETADMVTLEIKGTSWTDVLAQKGSWKVR